MSASGTRRRSTSRIWLVFAVGLLSIGLAVLAVMAWARPERYAPQHKADAFAYQTYPSPDGRLEARVYRYVSFFTERQEVTLRRVDDRSSPTEVSLGCDQAEDGAQITNVVFSSNDTLALQRADFPSITLMFDLETLRPVETLGSC